MELMSAIGFINWYFFSKVDGLYLEILRICVFTLPLYLLLSRYYTGLDAIPAAYFKSMYRGKRISTLTLLSPEQIPFRALHAIAILFCVLGIIGVLPTVAAIGASLTIIILNNYYATITTSDLEVLPYVVAMWPFAVLSPAQTVPVWEILNGTAIPDAPAFPFRVIQIYFCAILFISGITKVPFWREWVLEKGVYYDAQNWNRISPYIDTYWTLVADTRDAPYLWETLGLLTIVIEVGAAVPLIYPPAVVVIWPAIIGLFVGNHLLRSTSFLLFPWLYLACFLPWIGGIAS